MAKNCGHTEPCGCGDTPLVTPPPCNTAPECVGEQCSELFDSNCIIYTGDPIMCDGDVVVPDCTRVKQALQNIVDYFCAFTPTQVLSNSIWVDTVYGDDSTGVYADFAKPFKTFAAGLRAAQLYIQSVNLGGSLDSETTLQTLARHEQGEFTTTLTEISFDNIPRVRVHVAPGVYNGNDDWQYILDNISLFPSADADVLSNNITNNSSFNLMMNFIDYELDAGATLINYGFMPIGTIAKAMTTGYEEGNNGPDYTYDINPMITNVYGKGNIYSLTSVSSSVPIFTFFFSPTSWYIEKKCKLYIEAENVMFGGGYSYGGSIQFKVKNFYSLQQSAEGDFGSYNFYLEEGTDEQESYLIAEKIIQVTPRDYNFGQPSVFWIGGVNFTCKANQFVGLNVQELSGELGNYKEFRSGDQVNDWYQKYFTANFTPAYVLAAYIDNYSTFKSNVFIDIDYMYVTGDYIIGLSSASTELNFHFNCKRIDVKPNPFRLVDDAGLNIYLFDLYDSGANTNAKYQIDTINIGGGELFISGLTVFGFSSNTQSTLYVKNTNVIVSGTSENPNRRKAFFQGRNSDMKLVVENCNLHFKDNLPSEFFFSFRPQFQTALPTANVRIMKDCISNVGNQPETVITNLIPSTQLIVTSEIILI